MNEPIDAVSIYERLAAADPARGDRVFSAAPLGSTEIRVGRSSNDAPVVLVSGPPSTRPSIQTRHVRADFGVRCTLVGPSGVQELTASVIECTTDDPSSRREFLVATTAVVAALGLSPSEAETAAALEALMELFRSMSAPPRTSVQGLWGELFVMSSSSDVDLFVDSWHVTQSDRHDFACEGQRIEVKTTSGRHRRHRFSLEQLESDDSIDIVVVSVQLEASAAGATIRELTTRLADRLGRTARLRLVAGVASSLGSEWEQIDRHRYDERLALKSIRCFAAESLPRPGALPAEVSDVRFTVDLAAVSPLDLASLNERGRLAGSLARGLTSA